MTERLHDFMDPSEVVTMVNRHAGTIADALQSNDDEQSVSGALVSIATALYAIVEAIDRHGK